MVTKSTLPRLGGSAARVFPNGEGVLVTGCSSGIGRAIAVHLAQRGFAVFATVRKAEDVDKLRQLNIANLLPTYPLDLSKLEHLPGIFETITEELKARGKEGLYAIVNNAGGGSVAPIELMDLDKLRIELETRILGPVALLQSFLPLIRQAHGRVVWIVTPGLIPIPFVSSIHACDFAVSCLARTLQLELKQWRIPSIRIKCGGIKTEASDRSARELEDSLQRWPKERAELYGRALQKQQEEFDVFDTKRTDPENVARIVYTALSSRKPKRSYTVGHMARAAATLELFPQSAVDWIMVKRS
jgi:NAD(P)-dependent dehydrogenase (short-subunit alcohol dehydrogenase family)